MPTIVQPSVEIRSRTWSKLLALDQTIRKRYPNPVTPGLDSLGLVITPVPQVEDYYCSPVNALRFASNGAEAVFSFMVFGGQITDETPIVLTCVGALEQRNFIVGKSLHDFLCLGYHRGFFAMENMGHYTTRTLNRLTSGRWQAKSHAEWWTGFGINTEQRPVLQYLRERLKLKPWRDPRRKFAKLQRTFLPHLELRTSLFSKDWEDDEFRAWKKWFGKKTR